MRRETLSLLLAASILLGFLNFWHEPNVTATSSDIGVSPTIRDFYINNTWAGRCCQFSFLVSDEVSLEHAVFGCNSTATFFNSSIMVLSGTTAWANYTCTLPVFGCVLAFQFWVWGTGSVVSATTGIRYAKVQVYDSSATGWNPPYDSLIDAIQSIDAANKWADVDTYSQSILGKKSIDDLANLVDGYAAAKDWQNVLKWSAYCRGLGIVRQRAIVNALGNYTMVGKLPYTMRSWDERYAFSPENRWGLYGFYWAKQFGVALSKWNIVAAYQQFNNSVFYSVSHPSANTKKQGLPLWIYSDGTGETFTDRYYDEDACTVSSYLIFYSLLNVSDALDQALFWWNYTSSMHWNSAEHYFTYWPNGGSASYECEAAFFSKIARELEYSVPDWTGLNNVLKDIQNRFLVNGWGSPQWLDSSGDGSRTTNVVVHEYAGNSQRRLQNTFGAWELLLGIYPRLDAQCQDEIGAMLRGDDGTLPAWSLLLNPFAGLYDNQTQLFGWMLNPSAKVAVDYSATSYAEILLFLMGIVPGKATVALPVEELNYEYIQDLNCQTFHLNANERTITVPISNSGNITFQYGTSPVTLNLNLSGAYEISFSNSWNLITDVHYKSKLDENALYFNRDQLYNATITARCVAENANVAVDILTDGSPTGYVTPYTFMDLLGTHTFTVATNESQGHPFQSWRNGEASPTITVNSGGTYQAMYADGSFGVTVKARCLDDCEEINVSATMDNSLPTYTTPFTFLELVGDHTFTVPTTDPDGHPFRRWSTGETNTTVLAAGSQMLIAYYGSSLTHAVAVTGISPTKTIVGQGFTLRINVTVANVGDYSEQINISSQIDDTHSLVPKTISLYAATSRIVTFEWNTTGVDYGNHSISAYAEPVQGEADTDDNYLSYQPLIHVGIPGDISGQTIDFYDGICNMRDVSAIVHRFGMTSIVPDWNANADINDDNVIDMRDVGIVCSNFGRHE